MLFQSLDTQKIISLSLVRRVFIFDSIHSTNQYFIDNISSLWCGDVCLAESQTQGRGRYGKYWISPMSNNIYLSIYWCLYNNVASIIELSLMASLVIGEILQSLGVRGLQIKWPNDIYVQDRKLAGVLVEVITKYDKYVHIVIGVGINVTTYKFMRSNIIRYISLEDMGVDLDRNIFVIIIINRLYQALKQFECFGFIPFFSRWLMFDHFINRSIKLLIGNKVISGVFRGINSHGALLLERSGLIDIYEYSNNFSLRF